MRSAVGAPRALPDYGSSILHPPIAAPPGVSAAPPMAPVEVWPWWLTEYQAAQDWSVAALLATIAASAITVVPSTFKYVVPASFMGVVKSLTVTIAAPTTSMNLTLTLLKNNGPIQGWTKVMPPGSGASESITYNGMAIRLQQNEVLTAQFAEGGGSSWTVTIEASGWQLPIGEIARVQQGVIY